MNWLAKITMSNSKNSTAFFHCGNESEYERGLLDSASLSFDTDTSRVNNINRSPPFLEMDDQQQIHREFMQECRINSNEGEIRTLKGRIHQHNKQFDEITKESSELRAEAEQQKRQIEQSLEDIHEVREKSRVAFRTIFEKLMELKSCQEKNTADIGSLRNYQKESTVEIQALKQDQQRNIVDTEELKNQQDVIGNEINEIKMVQDKNSVEIEILRTKHEEIRQEVKEVSSTLQKSLSSIGDIESKALANFNKLEQMMKEYERRVEVPQRKVDRTVPVPQSQQSDLVVLPMDLSVASTPNQKSQGSKQRKQQKKFQPSLNQKTKPHQTNSTVKAVAEASVNPVAKKPKTVQSTSIAKDKDQGRIQFPTSISSMTTSSVSEANVKNVPCPLCGIFIRKSGLERHTATATCQQRRKKMENNNSGSANATTILNKTDRVLRSRRKLNTATTTA